MAWIAATACLMLLLSAGSATWTAASYVDAEYASSAFTAATLPAITPTVSTGPTSAGVSWNPTSWSGSTYTLTRATDSGGTGAATAYTGSASSTTDNGEFSTAAAVLSHATAVSAATSYTCALTESGVYCWGLNGYNQTGSTSSSVTTPTLVAGLPGVPTAISTGYHHACAIVAGAAWCWGSNISGQLGNGTSGGQTATPVAVTGLSGKTVTAISAGFQSTCAIASGGAYCWGKNGSGEVGDGTTIQKTAPVAVLLPAGRVDSISTSRTYVASGQTATTCAAVAGAAYCWGSGTSGQLGNGATTSNSTPQAVSTSGALAGRIVTSVSVSMTGACATTDTTVACWGDDTYGQLGNGTSSTTPASSPVTVSSISGVSAGNVSSALGYSCAVVSAKAWCWGGSGYSLGTGASSNQTIPAQVTTTGALSGVSVSAVTTASDHACAVGSGALSCWGDNSSAELGNGGTTTSSTPVAATALTVTGCANGANLLSDGNCSLAPYTTYFWKLQNQLSGWTSPTSGWVSATTTGRNAVTPTATPTAGSASFNWNAYTPTGQQAARYVLQRSTSSTGTNPTTVYDGGAQATTDTGGIAATAPTITGITNGDYHNCALTSTSVVYCWGAASSGQLGNGTTSPTTVLTPTVATVMSGKTVTAISAGVKYTCAVAAGAVYCWGYNSKGQLGNGTKTTSATTTAQAVQGISGTVTAISAGVDFICALTSTGDVYCWGNDGYGQLGDGGNAGSYSATAIKVTALTSVKSLSAGWDHACALTGAAVLYCWGYNNLGQLGNNTTNGTGATAPAAVYTDGNLAGETLTSVSAGFEHTCAVASDGKAFCWGNNGNGQLGSGTSGTSVSAAVQVSLPGKSFTAIAAGDIFTCGIASGAAYCWGYNAYGELGNNSTSNSSSPVAVSITSGTSSLAGKTPVSISTSDGTSFASACATDGSGVYCWGYNSNGQAGNGTTTSPQTSPVTATITLSGWSCPTGSTLVSALTCSLVSSTTYYYQLTYYLGTWTGPSSGWVAVTTTSSG